MLHIKDIEAFARINEALARKAAVQSRVIAPRRAETVIEPHRPSDNPAAAFARLAAGMMAGPAAFWARPTALPWERPVGVANQDSPAAEPPSEAAVSATATASAEVVPMLSDDETETLDAHAEVPGGITYDFDLLPKRAAGGGLFRRMFPQRRQ